MKFFAVVFILLGVLVMFGGLVTAAEAYQFAAVPNPTPAPEPGVPQLTGGAPVYSSLGSNFALVYVLGAVLLGLGFIAQGTLFYTVGDINEKIDLLLKDE